MKNRHRRNMPYYARDLLVPDASRCWPYLSSQTLTSTLRFLSFCAGRSVSRFNRPAGSFEMAPLRLMGSGAQIARPADRGLLLWRRLAKNVNPPVHHPSHNDEAARLPDIGPVIGEHPAPVPDTGPPILPSEGYGYPLANPAPTTPPRPGLPVHSSSVNPILPLSSEFSALAPLASSANPQATTASSASEPSIRPSITRPPQVDLAEPRKMDLTLIILLAVGAFLTLMGSLIVLRICLRHRNRQRPTPSLPILHDDFVEDEKGDSPLFGGKERFSPLPGTAGHNWTWVQYSRPEQTTNHNMDTTPSQPNQTALSARNLQPSASSYLFADGYGAKQSPAPTNATNRLSTLTTSMYSPQSQAAFANIGIAISNIPEESPSLTTELPRPKGESRRDSRSSVGLAYDDEREEISPATPTPAHYGRISEGRTRVNSGYFATKAYPRVPMMPSASYSIGTATRVKVGQRNSLGLHRTNSRRLRETQALTYALGLAPSQQGEDASLSTSGSEQNTLSSTKSPESPAEAFVRSDKPPRVPSPPALPSLAQMALAHNNPEDYGNYRSATYSIYGLYEPGDRRSRS